MGRASIDLVTETADDHTGPWRWIHIAPDGTETNAHVVSPRTRGAAQADVDRINAAEGRTVYRVEPTTVEELMRRPDLPHSEP